MHRSPEYSNAQCLQFWETHSYWCARIRKPHAYSYEEVRNGELGGEEDGVEFAAVERVVERRQVRVREAAHTRPRAVRARDRAAAARVDRAGEFVELHRTRAELELAEDPRELRTTRHVPILYVGVASSDLIIACALDTVA